VTQDSITAYEVHAQKFLQQRDLSKIGVQVVSQWAESRQSGGNVVEIACGGGLPVTQSLVDAELHVWAIDSSPTLINTFKKRFPDIPAECASVLESDYFGRKFDAAISIGLIFLLNESDQFGMLNRLSQVLNPGANFLFTAPIETGSWTDINTGHHCLSLGQESYQNALREAGFRFIQYHMDSGKNNYFEVEKLEI